MVMRLDARVVAMPDSTEWNDAGKCSGTPRDRAGGSDRALAAAFRAYVATATICLVIATAAGLLLAFKFGAPDFGATRYLIFGRLRPRRFHRPTPIMPVIRPFPDVDQRRCVPRHLRSGHATPAWRHVWCTHNHETMRKGG
ncbi:hypothetical protein [Rhodanobacter lindaniclasticus]|jgi:hypothetical protein|uniref:Uncharacterized protein n=1 Tax=Rhodanobacter lindaniclasticus TaxID=75310 RepID=A0A4S3KFL2_9GAMM|nr:hypothetical protein [Rhodanobacter lindaniclasticus]THD07279.1 hypothetical protein B1991_10215 [Rhodanobacter lindaniclasticus]